MGQPLFLGLDSEAELHLNTRITARRTSEFRIDLERSVAKRRAPGHYHFWAMLAPVFYSLSITIKIWLCLTHEDIFSGGQCPHYVQFHPGSEPMLAISNLFSDTFQ
jgi:hypothetical protein